MRARRRAGVALRMPGICASTKATYKAVAVRRSAVVCSLAVPRRS